MYTFSIFWHLLSCALICALYTDITSNMATHVHTYILYSTCSASNKNTVSFRTCHGKGRVAQPDGGQQLVRVRRVLLCIVGEHCAAVVGAVRLRIVLTHTHTYIQTSHGTYIHMHTLVYTVYSTKEASQHRTIQHLSPCGLVPRRPNPTMWEDE